MFGNIRENSPIGSVEKQQNKHLSVGKDSNLGNANKCISCNLYCLGTVSTQVPGLIYNILINFHTVLYRLILLNKRHFSYLSVCQYVYASWEPEISYRSFLPPSKGGSFRVIPRGLHHLLGRQFSSMGTLLVSKTVL